MCHQSDKCPLMRIFTVDVHFEWRYSTHYIIVNVRFLLTLYTYTQIRDGQYGFSHSFGKYCNQKFPDEIFSSDKYLWLRFHSDDNIEYEGFEGVFEYVERPKKTGKKTQSHWMCFLMAQMCLTIDANPSISFENVKTKHAKHPSIATKQLKFSIFFSVSSFFFLNSTDKNKNNKYISRIN